jgi:hypothetical protein
MEKPKEVYVPPELIVYGNVEEITQQGSRNPRSRGQAFSNP